MRNLFGLLFFIALFLFVLFAFRPIQEVSLDQCIAVDGQIELIEEGVSKDITFSLKGDDHQYYINRGLEKNLSIATLRELLTDQQVTIYYVDHWTPLDPKGKVRHIAKLSKDTENIYDETTP